MIDNKDLLHQLFEKHIKDISLREQSDLDFVRAVVFEYWQELQNVGFIPGTHSDEILEDLELEVTEMLRKTIYGYFNLQSFRESKKFA